MKLDQFIKQHGMTQTQFAKRTGLSVSSISRIVNGEREPSLRVMQIIYRATDGKVRPDDFFTD
jgi:transcriptional regulator with XRE-family HTH domain